MGTRRRQPTGLDLVAEELEGYFSELFRTRLPVAFISEQGWRPATDVYETAGGYIVVVEIPGVPVGEVEVRIHQGSLIVKGRRRGPGREVERRYHKMEIATGPFERRIRLPGPVDARTLTVTAQDGLLEIRLGRGAGRRRRALPARAD